MSWPSKVWFLFADIFFWFGSVPGIEMGKAVVDQGSQDSENTCPDCSTFIIINLNKIKS